MVKNIHLDTQNNIIFDIELRGRIVVVDGLSGSGKTFLWNTVANEQLNGYSINKNNTDLSNIVLINIFNKVNLEKIPKENGKLFIIDNADIMLNQEMANYIARDRNNQYLIYSRSKLEFHISPNYYANMVRKGNKYELEYKYSEDGWF